MPRSIDPVMTPDDLETEVVFTQSALNADPDARDFLPQTAGWLEGVDTLRPKLRARRIAEAEADAVRAVANSRFDLACGDFARDLKSEVREDLDHPRFTTFFAESPSAFVRQPVEEQVTKVEGWLASTDSVLLAHKPALVASKDAVRAALQQTAGVTIVQGEGRAARAEHAATFSRQRDALHADLVKRAVERNLPRTWADTFFRTESKKKPAEKQPPANG